MNFEITGLDHVQLAMPAGGEDVAEAFYCGLLGFVRVPKPEPMARRGGCWFASVSAAVHLGVDADFRPARKAHPALEVEGLAGLIKRLRDDGATVVAGEGDGGAIGRIQFYVDDPFGNRIELLGNPSSD